MNQSVHVLLVEDSDKDAALIIRELRKAGLDALSERVDRAEALERALQSRRWDIVLADYEMPSFDALRALQIVRAHDAEVSFVVVSGTIGENVAVEMMRAGAQDYVMKDRLARLGPLVKREIAETGVRRERARAISALRDSEARKAAILEAALDAVFTMDHQGCVVDLNTAAERMFGYSQEDAVGKDMADLIIPPSIRDAHRQGLSHYLATGEGPVLGKRIEFPAMRRDGSLFPSEIAIARIARPGPPMFTGFIRDVTDRKKLESRQRLLAEAGAILVKSLDRAAMMQGVVELVVAHLADWCGVDLLDRRGDMQRVAAALRRSSGDQGEVPTQVDRLASITLRTVRERKAALLSKSSPELGSCIVVPLIARERCLGAMAFVRAPERRSYSPDDLDFLKEFSARCAMAVDNAQLFQEVRESVKERDEFMAIAAHELRTPLTPLRMQAESLARRIEDNRRDALSPEQLEKPVRHIRRSVERLAVLVERLLDFSQLTIGGIRIELEDYDLVVLVSDLVRYLQPELDRLGSTVVWNVPNTPAIGRWDRRRLSLAIQNLLSNAIKFAPGKPIEVSVHAAPAEARLTIKDQGPGISPEDQARLFERYHRQAPIQHYGGFGLGLWIVRRIVEEHGGRVEVRSELGKGAEFTLVLPRRPVLVTADRPFTKWEERHDGP